MNRLTLRFTLLFLIGLAISVGAVFALTKSTPEADSVAILKTTGMTCGSCAGRIETTLKGKPGVASVTADVESGRVTIGYDSKVAKPETLAQSVTGIGYGSSVLQVLSHSEYESRVGKNTESKTVKAGCACCNK